LRRVRRCRSNHDTGTAIDLLDHDIDTLTGLDCDSLADDVRLYRKLSSTPVDEHRQSDVSGPAKVGELIEGRADSATSVENVVDDHYVASVDRPGDVSRPNHRARAYGLEVVTIERDVERTLKDLRALAFFDHRRKTPRQLHAATLYSDDYKIFGSVIELDYLVGNSLERSFDGALIQYNPGFCRSGWHRMTNMTRTPD
jgi:hypothetical protein